MGQNTSKSYKKNYAMLEQHDLSLIAIIDKSIRYHTLETTVKNFVLDKNTGHYCIQCDPSASDLHDIILEKSHPNFITLCNTIKIGTTYKFTFYYVADLVIPLRKCRPIFYNIGNCTIYQISKKIINILSVKNVINDLKLYDEIIVENNSDIRLIQKLPIIKNNMIGQTRNISYNKIYGSNFYEITSSTLG